MMLDEKINDESNPLVQIDAKNISNQATLAIDAPKKRTAKAQTAAQIKRQQQKADILHALFEFLMQPNTDKVTLLHLAKMAKMTQAALLKHFADKYSLFIEAIVQLESHIFEQINQIEDRHEDGMYMLNEMVVMLFDSVESTPAFVKLLTQEALFLEDARLSLRIQQLIDRIEASIRQAYRIAAAQGHITKGEDSQRAQWLMCYIMGAWQRYSRSSMHGFNKKPNEIWALQKKNLS